MGYFGACMMGYYGLMVYGSYDQVAIQAAMWHSLKVNNAIYNANCATMPFSSHQLLFNSKTRKGAKLALCKTMPLCKKINVDLI